MPKDPRFNFYPDNWVGGTEGFTLEQEGAYLNLIIMQTKVGRFTSAQAFDKLMQRTRGNTAVSTALWNFLIPKFETDGEFFWSARLEMEIQKSKNQSEKQKERISKRWNKSGIDSGITAVIPFNRTGTRIGIETEKEGGTGEGADFADYEQWVADAKSGNDFVFADLIRAQGLQANGHMAEYCDSYLALLAEYPRKRPPDQHRFRIGLSNHIREKLKTKQHDKHTNPPSAQTFEARRNYAGKL